MTDTLQTVASSTSEAPGPILHNVPPLIAEAMEHCLFALRPRAETERDGPPILVEGSGSWFKDVHGTSYLDMLSSNTRASTLGYGNEEVARAMYDQARRMHYAGTVDSASEPMELLGELQRRLHRLGPAAGEGDLVEAARRQRRDLGRQADHQQQSGRKPRAFKTISRWNAYHGSTMGALAVTDWLSVRDIADPRLAGHSFVANPMRYRNTFGLEDEAYADLCVKHLERQILLEGPDLVAAFIGEGVMQANGVQIPVPGYWPRVREICSRYGIVMIVDEVITGFGRVGEWFVSSHLGIEPDMITMAKAMSAGFAPMGAVITTDEIANGVGHFRHVHTFAGHAVGCAASNAVIAIKERDGLVAAAKANGPRIQAALHDALGQHPNVGQIRGLGHWHAVDFTADRSTKEPLDGAAVVAIVRRMREKGVIASAIGTALEIAPPLVATQSELDHGIETCARAVYEVIAEHGLAG